MRIYRKIFALIAAAVLLGGTASAHHAFGKEFDEKKPVTLEGVVTRIAWENPHVHFYVDVKQSDGTVVNWTCETRGPNGLEHQGWKRDSMKVGDQVIVKGFLARDGSHLADGRRVTLTNGHRILYGPHF
jgi:Family of unknown function (DUF6152)